MRGRKGRRWGARVAAACLSIPAAGAAGPEGTLRFADGGSLPGALVGIRANGDLAWACPYVAGTAVYRLDGLASASLPGTAGEVDPRWTLVELTNGDVFAGRLLEMTGGHVLLESAAAGRIEIDRRMVRTLEPGHERSPYLYRGPSGLEGWTLEPGGGGGWQARGDALVAPGGKAVSISRTLPSADRMVLDFEMACTGRPALEIRLWEDERAWYALRLDTRRTYLRAVYAPSAKHPRGRRMGTFLHPAVLVAPSGRGRLTLVADRGQNAFRLFADGRFVGLWAAQTDGPVTGNGLRFMSSAPVELSHLRVYPHAGGALVAGRPEPEEGKDLLTFVNGDTTPCEVVRIDEAGVHGRIGGEDLVLPHDRVISLEFAASTRLKPRRRERDVRVHLAGGERFTLALEAVAGERLTGRADAAGGLSIPGSRIQQLDFHPYTAEAAAPDTAELVFSGGHRMSGRLVPGAVGDTMAWRHPAALAPVACRVDAVQRIRRAPRGDPDPAAARVELRHGDVLYGAVAELDGERLLLDTPHAGRLRIARDAVARIQPAPDPGVLLYGGPTSADAWTPYKPTRSNVYRAWSVEEGGLVSSGGHAIQSLTLPGLPSRCRLDFDMLPKKQTPRLNVTVFGVAGADETRAQGWTLRVGRGQAVLFSDSAWRRVDAVGLIDDDRFRHLVARVSLCVDNETGRAVLAADGDILGDWRREGGSTSAPGDRLVFHGMGSMRVGRIRLYTWDGTTLPDTRLFAGGGEPGEARIAFLDRPALGGDVLGIRDGVLAVRSAADGTTVEHPLGRVTEIDLAAPDPPAPPAAGRVRLFTRGCDRITAELLRVDGETLALRSPALDAFDLRREAVADIDFRPGPPPAQTARGPKAEPAANGAAADRVQWTTVLAGRMEPRAGGAVEVIVDRDAGPQRVGARPGGPVIRFSPVAAPRARAEGAPAEPGAGRVEGAL